MLIQRFSVIFLLGAVLELYLFVKVAEWIGFLPMVLLAVATSVLGVLLFQLQGAMMREKLTLFLSRGQFPAPMLLEGGMGWISALLLMIPGFFTDALGLLCLIPMVRRSLARRFMAAGTRPGNGEPPPPSGPRTIEGSFTRERDDP